jgi:hypothetical protein
MITLHNLLRIVWSLAHSPLFIFLACLGLALVLARAILPPRADSRPLAQVLDQDDPDYDFWNE